MSSKILRLVPLFPFNLLRKMTGNRFNTLLLIRNFLHP